MLLEELGSNRNAVINPELCADRLEDFPSVTISCFSEKLFNAVLAFLRQNKLRRFIQQMG